MEQAVDAALFFGRFRLEEASGRLVDLVKRAATGDAGAFNSLIIKLEPRLRATARARSRGSLSDYDIDDVLQNTWMEMMKPGALAKFADKPEGLVPFMHAIVKNKTINMSKAKTRAGKTYRSMGKLVPAAPGVALTGRGRGKLSAAEKKVVRRAVNRALAKAALTDKERMFIAMLFGGEDVVPGYGRDVKLAKKVGVETGKTHKTVPGVGAWAYKTKQKFLRHFCTDQELCDLLPSGRALTKAVKIPGLGQNACKGVKDSCTESEVTVFAHRAHLLDEDHPKIDEGKAVELVLSWLTEVLAGT
jgi:DNA-directed RNA polymerase specialized sigma24 family protein